MYNDEGVVYDGENSLVSQSINGNFAIDGHTQSVITTTVAPNIFTGDVSSSRLINCTGDHLSLNSLNANNVDFQTCNINGGNINNTSMYNTTLMNPNLNFATLNGGTLVSVVLSNTLYFNPGTLITIDDFVIESTELKKMLRFIQKLHKDLHPEEYRKATHE